MRSVAVAVFGLPKRSLSSAVIPVRSRSAILLLLILVQVRTAVLLIAVAGVVLAVLSVPTTRILKSWSNGRSTLLVLMVRTLPVIVKSVKTIDVPATSTSSIGVVPFGVNPGGNVSVNWISSAAIVEAAVCEMVYS